MKTISSLAAIERGLRTGGALQLASGVYTLQHPLRDSKKIAQASAEELLATGRLVVVNCGCTGWWWALRPDLLAEGGK